MKKTILLSLLMFIFGSALIAQATFETVSATYTVGDILTDDEFDQFGEVSTCPGLLNVPVPNNAIIVSVDVEYSMTAITGASMNNGWSQVVCTSPNGLPEPAVYQGTGGWGQGTETYSRTGLTIANGVIPIFGFGVNFELHAGTAYWNAPVGCGDLYQVVDDGTWIVTVTYLAAGAPGTATNPSPADISQLVDLDADLAWTFGTNTTTYDLYLGTDNPPTTIVVPDGTPGGATGSFEPGTLLEATEYFWRVVGKNANNENPGNVWSFTTKCATPTYPYFENFDGVTSPDFPSCWLPLSSSASEYSGVKNYYDQWGGQARSAPNVIQFNADAEPNPNMLLVLPEVGTVSDKILSLYGMNNTNWISGTVNPYPIEVGTITDPFDINTFTAYTSYIPGANWTLLEVFFADYTGSDTYIAIKGVVPQYETLWMDDVTLDFLPTCTKPIDLVADEVLAEQATISWTDMNGATSWNIEYVISGTTPTGTPTVTGVTNPTTITGLLDAEYYDIYVQTDCGGGDLSDWSWPLSIVTGCLPFDVPFFEDFGDPVPYPEVYTPPLCWEIIDIHSGQFGGIGFDSYESHTGMGIWMSPEGDNLAELIISSPEVSVGINTLRTTFWAKTSSSTQDSLIIVGTMSDPLDETTFTPYDTIDGITQDFQLYKVYFNNYVGTDLHIAWRHSSEEHSQSQAYIDDITIETIPACVEPYKSYLGDVTVATAWLHWTEPVETATDWEVQVGLMGFHPDSATAPTNTYTYNNTAAFMQSFEMTGLNAGTVYQAYVRTDCGGSTSIWEGPVTLQTNFAGLTLPYSEDFETGFGTTLNSFENNFDWAIDDVLTHSGTGSVWADPPVDNQVTSTLAIAGIFDMTAKANQMLTFWHIPKTDGNYSHCYIEISTDGGATFAPLPESTYFGAGNYYLPTGGNPIAGPAFDEDSYPEYGTGNELPDNTWWRKEYFNLSDYSAFDNVVFRFRLQEYYTNKAGWWIDDISIEDLGTPDFSVTPLTITEDATPVMPAMLDMTMGNAGTLPASYTANVVYDEVDLWNENFDVAGTPAGWTVVHNGSNAITWANIDLWQGYSFDGTRFMLCDGYQNYGPVATTMDEELISPVIDASAYIGGALQLEFDQAFDADYNPGDTARVYVYDGTDWIMIYESWTDDGKINWQTNGVHKVYDVSMYANANFQVKFHYIEASITSRGQYFAIDNFRLRASNYALGWLTVDGAEVTEGVSMPDVDMIPAMVNVYMDATGLAEGTYTAEILVTSTDAGNPSTTIPVTLNVVAGSTISGNITYANVGMTALENCSVELRDATDAVLFSTMTDATGYYEFTGILDGDYTLVTTSATAYTYVTNLADVNVLVSHLLGTPLTGVYYLAGEVSGDDIISLADYNLMVSNLLGELVGYPDVEDWRFEVQNVMVSGANSVNDFQGIMSGDTDGSW